MIGVNMFYINHINSQGTLNDIPNQFIYVFKNNNLYILNEFTCIYPYGRYSSYGDINALSSYIGSRYELKKNKF